LVLALAKSQIGATDTAIKGEGTSTLQKEEEYLRGQKVLNMGTT